MSCNKAKVATGGNRSSSPTKTPASRRAFNAGQSPYGTPKLKVSFAKRGR